MSEIEILHAIPGRVRLRIPQIKHDPSLPQEVRSRLTLIDGIERVEANGVTGSVLVFFHQERMQSFDSLVALSRALTSLFPDVNIHASEFASLLDASPNGTHANGHQAAVQTDWLTSVFRHIGVHSAESLKTALPLVLFALGVRQLLVADKVTFPQWYDFFWFAFATHHMVDQPATANERLSG